MGGFRGGEFVTTKTHIAIGTMICTPFVIVNPISIIGLIGCTFPDVDIRFGMKSHRTFAHSILCLFLTTYFVNIFSFNIAFVWFLSYTSHLLLDSFTKGKIMALYPKRKRYGLGLFLTGGIVDYCLRFIGVIGIIILICEFIFENFKFLF